MKQSAAERDWQNHPAVERCAFCGGSVLAEWTLKPHPEVERNCLSCGRSPDPAEPLPLVSALDGRRLGRHVGPQWRREADG